jgi:parallel beta helix pectate lyase-like protein
MSRSLMSFALAAVVVTLALPSVASALATRTWVSGVGDDANPCSRTAPCKTFAGAITKTTAGGEINCLDPGGFGQAVITKSLTIDGTGNYASTLVPAATGILINITAATDIAKTVRLRGLSLNGTFVGVHGIRVVAARKVMIEDMVIDGFTQTGITIDSANANVFVKRTTIRNIMQAGINVSPITPPGTTALWVDQSSILNCRTALEVRSNTNTSLRDTSIINNRTGLTATDSEVSVVNCNFSQNVVAIEAGTRANIYLSFVTVAFNQRGMEIQGGKIVSFKNNFVHSNIVDGAPTSTLNPV